VSVRATSSAEIFYDENEDGNNEDLGSYIYIIL